MAKHTLKILWCSIARFLKYAWPFYNIMHERVKNIFLKKLRLLKHSSVAERNYEELGSERNTFQKKGIKDSSFLLKVSYKAIFMNKEKYKGSCLLLMKLFRINHWH